MKKFYLMISLCLFLQINIYSQSPIIQQIINSVNQDSLIYFIRELSGDIPTIINGTSQTIVSRNSFQPGNELAQIYIKQKFEYYGLNTSIQSFGSSGQNVLATQPGTDFPDVKYILCAHYDDMPLGVTAPGADDNASGTAAVIEAARILSQYSFPITIIYAAWDQEEQGLFGSAYYAQQAAFVSDSILGVINLDMMAYDSDLDNVGEIHTNSLSSSQTLKNKMVEVNTTYSIGITPIIYNPGADNGDHASFWDHGYGAILLIEEYYGGDFNPNYHTIYDLVQYLNPQFILKLTKLSLGVLADLSLASIYGAISAINPYVDKTYAKKNIDSVLFLTKFKNVYSHPFTTNLIYSNKNRTQVDSLSLFDDGLHGDSLSNDGIYGAYIPPQPYENNYRLDVSTVDLQTNKYFLTPDISSFTTAGPVVLDSIVFIQTSYSKYCRPFITNKGDSILQNVTGKLICNDPWVTNINPSTWTIQNLPPEVSTGSSGLMVLSIIDSIFPGYINFEAKIGCDNWPYWVDSLQLIVGVEDKISLPLNYSLEQNYPNPFNPSTRIQYAVSSRQFVKLTVYDVLGEEIATLVNEEKPVGTYELTWNAENLPSGVYFYQLKAGTFIETKKMILLK